MMYYMCLHFEYSVDKQRLIIDGNLDYSHRRGNQSLQHFDFTDRRPSSCKSKLNKYTSK